MNDHLSLALAALRADAPEPDAAAVNAAYAEVMARVSPRRERHRMIPASRSRVALVVVLGLLILVPTAFAVRGTVIDAFTGTPPTPTVTEQYSQLNALFDMSTADAAKRGFAQVAPHVDASKAHGLVQVQTSDGPEQLWSAPASDGSACLLAVFVADASSGQMWCDSGKHLSNVSLSWEENVEHPTLETVVGFVYVNAATVTLTLADDSSVTAPVVEGAYLISLPHGMQVTHIAADDASGNEVGSYDPPTPPPSDAP